MQPIKSQRQYELAKRDAARIDSQINQLSESFDAEIAVLEQQVATKKAAKDQASAFLRRDRDQLLEAIGEWEAMQEESDGQQKLEKVG